MVEGTGLENRQGLIALRGFESHPLRHFFGWYRSVSTINLVYINKKITIVLIFLS